MRKFSTLAASLALVLLFFACGKEKKDKDAETKTSEAKTAHSLIHNVEFNGEKISIKGFQPDNPGEAGNIIDSLSFTYNGTEHTIRLPSRGEEGGPWYFDVSVKDYNFDNYMDIAILFSRGTGGQIDYIFLYNPKTKSYLHHEELSGLWSVWPDSKTKTVKSHAKGGHAGMLYESSEYKWENEKLVMIQSEKQDHDEASDQYIRITKTLQNGKWLEKKERVIVENGEMLSISIPDGYELSKRITGDLNNDGKDDVVLIIKGTDKSKIVQSDAETESGEKKMVNLNKRGIIIDLKKGDGYERVLENRECLSEEEDDQLREYPYYIRIERGSLFISFSHHRFVGCVYNFKYRNSDFERIGYDYEETEGSVCAIKKASVNYITKKMVINLLAKKTENNECVFNETWKEFALPKPIKLRNEKYIGCFDASEGNIGGF